MHVRISAHIKWKLRTRPKYRRLISTGRMQQTAQVSKILSYTSLSHFPVEDNVYDSYFDHKKNLHTTLKLLKIIDGWAEAQKQKEKNGHFGLPLHFLGLLLDAWLEDCLLLTGWQQQLITTLRLRVKMLEASPPTFVPARTQPLSGTWGESNWGSEKPSVSRQELAPTLQRCEEIQGSANSRSEVSSSFHTFSSQAFSHLMRRMRKSSAFWLEASCKNKNKKTVNPL